MLPEDGDMLDQSGSESTAEADRAEETLASERENTISWIREQVARARPISGTPAERYLIEYRGLHPPWPSSLHWAARYQSHPGAMSRSCLIATVTNAEGEIVALQSTEIELETGAKSSRTDKPRRSRGPVGEGAVFLGNQDDPSQTLVLGEGVETVLTRCMVGPCDAYACLGPIRFIEPKHHHRRIEILADTDQRAAARRLARDYAKRNVATYVITVPDSLGPKADLNDVVLQLGSTAVLMAIEDAERFTQEPSRYGASQFNLEIGSDIEIAKKVLEQLEELYGPIIVSDARLWRFDKTHWAALDDDHLIRLVHRADGTRYADGSGKNQVVKLSKSRVISITDAMMRYRGQPDFFQNPPCGINCESGFIRIGDDGSAKSMPHARQWRQRHVVRGRWPIPVDPIVFETSRLAKYLRDCVAGDADAAEKVNLLGEIAGCTALGRGTRLRNPKAIVAFSEEGATGKSTFLKLLRALPNPEAVSSVPPGKFGDEKYAWRLIGKVLNAADELPDRAVKADVFKRMITGEPVPARDVYRSATDFVPTALHVFSTNVLPSFSGGVDGGVIRRLLPIDFVHVVPEADRDPDLPHEILSDEADLLLHFAVEGACRLVHQQDFTVPASSAELLQRWMLTVDPVRSWAVERLEITSYEHVMPVSALYDDFQKWAEVRGLKRDMLPSVISFGKRLRKAAPGLEYQRSDGSFCRNARLRRGA
jgi:P4 family phage/plasmid primase-like protien